MLPLMLALACACSAEPDLRAQPEDIALARARVAAFMEAYRAAGFRGLPDTGQALALSPHLSPRLNGLLRDALAGQQGYKARYPSDKPPMVDGDIFSSLFEGATSGIVEALEVAGSVAGVRVAYTYSDPETGKALHAWKDRFLLVRTEGAWRIDDVEYLGGWDFAPRGRLSTALAETASIGR